MRQQGERRQGGGSRREKPEYDQKVLDIRRTARVVAGGRRFSFRASVVIGNRNGKVGLGMGKGADVSSAVEKAVSKAKKDMIVVAVTKAKTIPYQVEGKASAARILLKPAQEGRGLVAGGPIRIIAELAGIRHITAKIVSRTPNKLNNAQATMQALKKLKQIVPRGAVAPVAAQ